MHTSSESHAGVRHSLDKIFCPSAIAVIGASETAGSLGRTVMVNLTNGPLAEHIYPVNPKRCSVVGRKAYESITTVPKKVDLAVIATPAQTVPAIIRQCGEMGVGGAIILSAGFKEMGPHGVDLESQVMAEARKTGMRLIGPNCLGVMNPLEGLNATFAATMARPGNVAFLSQSGALCTAILDWSLRELVGFSAFVSAGSMLDVGWGDLIDYLGSDPRTHSILIYMESVGDARSFLSAAREVALSKPIIVLKAGRTGAAAKAAASHTGALTGSDEVFDAACRRIGILRVNQIADLFYMAEVLARQPRPRGPRLNIVTNAGGPAVLAADALIGAGGELGQLSDGTRSKLNDFLPAHWSHANPIDILGDAGPQRYAQALAAAAADSGSDGLLVILTPQDMTQPTQTAEALVPYANADGKPVLASWMGGDAVAEGVNVLNRAGIPTFAYPDTAARAFTYMWSYSYNLRGIYETPAATAVESEDQRPAVGRMIDRVLVTGRVLLDEQESKQILEHYGIPTVPTQTAATENQAIAAAESLGYPVVLKLYSKTVTHKSDAGGVVLNLSGPEQVRHAFRQIRAAVDLRTGEGHFQGVTVQPMIRTGDGFEIILGSSIDPQFGPVLLFGAGGQFVEVFKDRALALPPLNATLARRMMEQTRVYQALHGARGRKPADLAALEQLLVRFSRLVVDHPRIREIDVNPLFVSNDLTVALDARIVLVGRETPDAELPRPAVRPYPSQYCGSWQMKDGTAVTIRPIRPEDEPKFVRFHQTLSEQSIKQRFFHVMKLSSRVTHERLTRICCVDYDREIAIVAEKCEANGGSRILGVVRLSKSPHADDAEFAVLIADDAQGNGLGTELVRRILQIAKREGVRRLWCEVLQGNTRMDEICQSLELSVDKKVSDGVVRAEIWLG